MAAVLPPGAPSPTHHAALLKDLGLVVEVEAGVALVHLPRGRVSPSLPAAQSLAVAGPHVWVAKSGEMNSLKVGPLTAQLHVCFQMFQHYVIKTAAGYI